jgi:hypothetical protein
VFRAGGRKADPLWEVAASTQVFTIGGATVERLAREVDHGSVELLHDGLLIARSHPTGWFVWAVRRDDLTGEDLDHFGELVVVRTYLLLRHGPVRTVWRPTPGRAEWRSLAASLVTEPSGA